MSGGDDDDTAPGLLSFAGNEGNEGERPLATGSVAGGRSDGGAEVVGEGAHWLMSAGGAEGVRPEA